MRGDRRQVEYARGEDHRNGCARERAHERTEPADAPLLPGSREVGEPQIVIGGVARVDERQAVSRRPGHQIDRARTLQQSNEPFGIPDRPGGRKREIQEHPALVEAAEIDADRSGVDADDARQ